MIFFQAILKHIEILLEHIRPKFLESLYQWSI
uniref:Uncharacterized protein n=1 Tax=Siphoviridae sp. ctB3v5 TaxID=2826186 RepID=A0A8S5M8Q0_9CAUD|nr:MAG TPA: hypothetical protein [Siphoviridae sp. ctB3v5]